MSTPVTIADVGRLTGLLHRHIRALVIASERFGYCPMTMHTERERRGREVSAALNRVEAALAARDVAVCSLGPGDRLALARSKPVKVMP